MNAEDKLDLLRRRLELFEVEHKRICQAYEDEARALRRDAAICRKDLVAALSRKRGWRRRMALRMLRMHYEHMRLRANEERMWLWHDEAQANKLRVMELERDLASGDSPTL